MNLFLFFLLFVFLTSGNFSITVTGFSIGMILIISLTGIYVGFKSLSFGEVQGVLVGLLSCSLLLLYISQYQEMFRATNLYIFAIFTLISFTGSFIGSFFRKINKDGVEELSESIDNNEEELQH